MEQEREAVDATLYQNGAAWKELSTSYMADSEIPIERAKTTVEKQLQNMERLQETANPHDGTQRKDRLEAIRERLEPSEKATKEGELLEGFKDLLFDTIVESDALCGAWHRANRLWKNYHGLMGESMSLEDFDKLIFSRTQKYLERKGGTIISEHSPLENAKFTHDLIYVVGENYVSEKDLGKEEAAEEIYNGPIEGIEKFSEERKRPIDAVIGRELEEAKIRKVPCFANATLYSIDHLDISSLLPEERLEEDETGDRPYIG